MAQCFVHKVPQGKGRKQTSNWNSQERRAKETICKIYKEKLEWTNETESNWIWRWNQRSEENFIQGEMD